MSAFIVDRNHIRYLVASALHVTTRMHPVKRFLWWHGEEWHELTPENATEVGQMLWDECIASVRFRYFDPEYPDDILPGPIDEDFTYLHQSPPGNFNPDLAQVFMAADCYDYQSCEHPSWEESSAKAFTSALRRETTQRLPGYDDALWGAPDVALEAVSDDLPKPGHDVRPLNHIIRANGTWEEYLPRDGKRYKLEELKAAIGGGLVEVMHLEDGRLMVGDDEAKLKGFMPNEAASALYLVGRESFGDFIAGDVLVCEDWMIG